MEYPKDETLQNDLSSNDGSAVESSREGDTKGTDERRRQTSNVKVISSETVRNLCKALKDSTVSVEEKRRIGLFLRQLQELYFQKSLSKREQDSLPKDKEPRKNPLQLNENTYSVGPANAGQTLDNSESPSEARQHQISTDGRYQKRILPRNQYCTVNHSNIVVAGDSPSFMNCDTSLAKEYPSSFSNEVVNRENSQSELPKTTKNNLKSPPTVRTSSLFSTYSVSSSASYQNVESIPRSSDCFRSNGYSNELRHEENATYMPHDYSAKFPNTAVGPLAVSDANFIYGKSENHMRSQPRRSPHLRAENFPEFWGGPSSGNVGNNNSVPFYGTGIISGEPSQRLPLSNGTYIQRSSSDPIRDGDTGNTLRSQIRRNDSLQSPGNQCYISESGMRSMKNRQFQQSPNENDAQEKKRLRLLSAPKRDLQGLIYADYEKPFSSLVDVWQRLIPYHLCYVDRNHSEEKQRQEWENCFYNVYMKLKQKSKKQEERLAQILENFELSSDIAGSESRPALLDEILSYNLLLDET